MSAVATSASRRAMLTGSVALLAGATALAASQTGANSSDAELIAVCAEFDALQRQSDDAFDAERAAGGSFDRADAASEPFLDKQRTLFPRLIELRARTPAGFEARANVMARWYMSFWQEVLEECVDPAHHGNWHYIMLATFMRDAIGHEMAPVYSNHDWETEA